MTKRFLFLILTLATGFPVISQNIDLDTTYGVNGFVDGVTNGNFINDAVMQPDGKILVAGPLNANTSFYISRYNTDGSLDTGFANNGTLIANATTQKDEIYDITLQADGKIIVSGQTDVNQSLFGVYNNAFIARINNDGTLDTGFGNSGFVNTELGSEDDFIGDVRIVSNGDLYAIGQTQPTSTDDDTAVLLKYMPNGTLDTTWGTNGQVPVPIVNEVVFNALRILNDGTIIIGGIEIINTTDIDFVIVKFNPDGSLNNTFGVNGIVRTDFNGAFDNLNNLLVKSSGEIVAIGNRGGNGQIAAVAISQYNSITGALDTSFDTDGKLVIPINNSNYGVHFGRQIKETSDGGFIIIAQTIGNNNYDFNITRINADGSLVNTFGNSGQFLVADAARQDYARNILLQDDGKVIIAGLRTSSSSTTNRVFLARFEDAIPLSIENISTSELITIYPNPTQDILQVSVPFERITIYSLTGKIVFTSRSNTIHVESLQSGSYCIKIETSSGHHIKQFIKE